MFVTSGSCVGNVVVLKRLRSFFRPGILLLANTAMSTNGAADRYSNHTLEKVARTKATIESFYANLITQHQERQNRSDRKTSPWCKLVFFGVPTPSSLVHSWQKYFPWPEVCCVKTDSRNLWPWSNYWFSCFRWKVLEMNMEQQGLTEEEVSW